MHYAEANTTGYLQQYYVETEWARTYQHGSQKDEYKSKTAAEIYRIFVR